MAHIIVPTDFNQRLPSLTPRDGFLLLMFGELELPAKPDAPILRSFASLIGPGQDEMTLEFRQSAQHSQHQPPARGRCVSPRITQSYTGDWVTRSIRRRGELTF